MTTTKPKMRVMRDEELDRPEQLECRLAQLRAELATADDKAQTVRRIERLKQRLNPNGTVKPPVPAIMLVSKRDVDDWGDRHPAM
jgi:hypothetical protein